MSVSATATDNVAVAGVQFLLDGAALGSEDTTAPYSMTWDTTTAPNGVHTIQARARDTAGNLGTSSGSVTVTVSNTAPPPPQGLVAGWSFNESSGRTASDVSGNGNTATVQGAPTWALGQVRRGPALQWDGLPDGAELSQPEHLGQRDDAVDVDQPTRRHAATRWPSRSSGAAR